MVSADANLEKAFRLIEENREAVHVAGTVLEVRIVRAEDLLGVRYPPSYRRFLAEYGTLSLGGVEFFGLTRDEDDLNSSVPNGVWLTHRCQTRSNLPRGVVLVADADDGDYYAIDQRRTDECGEGAIVIWRPEVSQPRDELEFIAPDFGAFFYSQVREAVERSACTQEAPVERPTRRETPRTAAAVAGVRWIGNSLAGSSPWRRRFPALLLVFILAGIGTHALSLAGLLLLRWPGVGSTFVAAILALTPMLVVAGVTGETYRPRVWAAAQGLAWACLMAGVALFLGPFVRGIMPASLVERIIPSSVELPLGKVAGIVIDRSGNLFAGSSFYGRIQKYGPHGRYMRGWFLDVRGGVFDLWQPDGSDEIHVLVARTDEHMVFSRNGDILMQETVRDSRQWQRLSEAVAEYQSADIAGALYTRGGWLEPAAILSVDSGMDPRTIVKEPVKLWLLRGPMPVLLYLVWGIVWLGLAQIGNGVRQSAIRRKRQPGSVSRRRE